MVEEDLAAAIALSSIEPAECPGGADGSAITCWRANLPLHADDPDASQMVSLMVAVVDNGDPLGIGPVAFLQGGPGVASVTYASGFIGLDHDVVFVDQRGTGESLPKLNCPEVDAIWLAERIDIESERLVDSDAEVLSAYEACFLRLAQTGVDGDAFNTEAVADDYAILRQLLGYDEWSLWGISYGTRIGLSIMRDHPEGIRAAVLDSVVPLEIDFFATLSQNGLRSFEALDRACEAQACGEQHGNFVDNLAALTRRLDETPLVVTATRPSSGVTYPYRIDGPELLSMVFSQTYSTRQLRSLPRQIARFDFGGAEEIVSGYVNRRDPEVIDLALGVYYTTWCREEFPFHDPTADDALLQSLEARFGSAFRVALGTEAVDDVCAFVDVAAGEPVDDEPVSSDIPTAVFAGAMDPITPPSWSRQVAEQLDAATYVEMPDHGHGMATGCPARMRIDFLIDPIGSLDQTCVSETGPPAFD